MRQDFSKLVQILANLAIVFVAILLGLVLIKNFVLADSAAPRTGYDVRVGSKITLPGVDWSRSNNQLVLVLQKGCHFCSESAPFYQRLVSETAGRSDLRLIAALPQSTTEAKKYLEEMGVSINEITQATPISLGARGTPSLLLIDSAGFVTDVWVGKLSLTQENEVLRRLALK